MASSTSLSLPTEWHGQRKVNNSSTLVPADVEPAIPRVHTGDVEDTIKQRKYKYSVMRQLFAFVFVWMITAAFVVLPGALTNLEQSHETPKVLRSILKVPLLALSCIFCLVGIVGICIVSWKYAHDHNWLFYEFYRPVASGGLFGVLSTIVDIYTAHNGKYSSSNIATLAAMGAIVVIFGLLALNSYSHINHRDYE